MTFKATGDLKSQETRHQDQGEVSSAIKAAGRPH